MEIVRKGLSGSGRLQKFLYKVCAQFLLENIDHDLLKSFFNAENLDDQRILFDKLPYDKLKESIRYGCVHANVCTSGILWGNNFIICSKLALIFFHFIHLCYIFSQIVTKLEAGRSEAQMKYVSSSLQTRIDTSWRHFCAICRNCPIKGNFYISLHCTGKRSMNTPIPQYCYPPYLTKEGFTNLKVNLINSARY